MRQMPVITLFWEAYSADTTNEGFEAPRGGERAMESNAATIPALTVVTAEHAHHWVIDEARGPVSNGVCKKCGLEKQFKNWIGETDFITNEEHRQAA